MSLQRSQLSKGGGGRGGLVQGRTGTHRANSLTTPSMYFTKTRCAWETEPAHSSFPVQGPDVNNQRALLNVAQPALRWELVLFRVHKNVGSRFVSNYDKSAGIFSVTLTLWLICDCDCDKRSEKAIFVRHFRCTSFKRTKVWIKKNKLGIIYVFSFSFGKAPDSLQ